MAIKLREGEIIHDEVHLHWSSLINPSLWAVLGVFAFIVAIAAEKNGGPAAFWGAIFCLPLLYRVLQNKFKSYIVTNQRVYIEEGIIAKSKNDIPIRKINDVSVKQGIIQRILGSGNVCVMTGNDKGTVLKDIDKPDNFKDTISNQIETKAAA